MYRKIFVFLLSAMLVLGLTACGGKEPTETHSSGPGRMVRRIEVSIQPEDPDLARAAMFHLHQSKSAYPLRAVPDPTGRNANPSATHSCGPHQRADTA